MQKSLEEYQQEINGAKTKKSKLRSSMRPPPKAATKEEKPDDVTSVTSDNPSSNPWADAPSSPPAQPTTPLSDALTKQVSRLSTGPAESVKSHGRSESASEVAASIAKAPSIAESALECSNGNGDSKVKEKDKDKDKDKAKDAASTNGTSNGTEEKDKDKDQDLKDRAEANSPTPTPKARRKKTVSKPTPHTFELEDELKKAKSKDKEAPAVSHTTKMESSVASMPAPPKTPPPPKMTFSTISTSANIKPVEPIIKTPRKKASQPATNNPFSPPSKTAEPQSNGIKVRQSPATQAATPFTFTPIATPLTRDNFFSKVVVVTHGASLTGSSLIRILHQAGGRVIFGDPSPERARKLVQSLGPPDTVNFNKCDFATYEGMLELFKLAITMYGRVDHAIFGVGDDGGQARPVGECERLWGLDMMNRQKLGKQEIEDIQKEVDSNGVSAGDIITASARFARIAITYLKHSSMGPKKKKGLLNGGTDDPPPERPDRTLTFLGSTAGFTPLPHLPIYSAAEHTLVGMSRSMAESISPYIDGVRINTVLTNMMVPTAIAKSGGGMQLQFPVDRPEDISRVIAGVIGEGRKNNDKAHEMHGRVLYLSGDQAVDLDDGLHKAGTAWMGYQHKEAFDKAHAGIGETSQWMLMDDTH